MSRACDPFSQASIHIVVDGDCIWRVPLALRRGDDTTFDPVMNDPHRLTPYLARTWLTASVPAGIDGAGIRCLYRSQRIMLTVKGFPVELVRPSPLSRATISLSSYRSARVRILATNASG